MRLWLVGLLLCGVGFTGVGQELDITEIERDGTLTWTHPYTSGVFRVEWVSSPGGPWFASWEGLLNLSPDDSGVLSIATPACYRVGRWPDGTGAGLADTDESSVDADPGRNSGNVEVVPHVTPGKLTWATDTNSTYRVEWASSADGPWFTDWQSLLGLTPQAASAAVPFYYRVLCTGSCDPSMAYIPAGPFGMGDSLGDEGFDELPVHSVHVSAFLMARTEVTKAKWDNVYGWAMTNGYDFARSGAGKAPDHPVQDIEWYDESYYTSSPTRDPRGPATGQYRMLRGGGWRSYGRQCRVAYRHSASPDSEYNSVGFRLVRSVP